MQGDRRAIHHSQWPAVRSTRSDDYSTSEAPFRAECRHIASRQLERVKRNLVLFRRSAVAPARRPVVGSDESRRTLAPPGDLSCRPKHFWGPPSPALRVTRTLGASVGLLRDDDS